MRISVAIAEGFSRWIGSVAGTAVGWLGRVASPRVVRLVETEDGVLQKDGQSSSSPSERIRIAEGLAPASLVLSADRVELILRPDRFLFKPLELPARAAEFLDGIVRSQIDRLTPWVASDAAFGWSRPVDVGADRVVITVAATALTLIRPYVQAIAGMGAHSIAVFTALPGTAAVQVWEERARGILDVERMRRALAIVAVAAGVAAVGAISAAVIVGGRIDARQGELARQIASVRAAAGASGDATLGSVAAAQRALAQRKQSSPSSVIVLETLSQILPDHTYVTELRIEGDKLRLIGITRDAPSLIGLIEQSATLARATFFAPTTRSPADPGERFHIEAHIQPLAPPRP